MASTARLLALADMVRTDPDRVEAELRAEAASVAGQRRRAGRASGAARRTGATASRAQACSLAIALRQADPARTAAFIVHRISATLGSAAPSPRTLHRWVTEWEVTKALGPALKKG